MTDDLVLYTNPMSRGRITRWMLEEVGEPYRVEVLDYATTMKAAEYLAVNPMGKVPALSHRGAVVTEVAAICAYLADAFPEAGLLPEPGAAQAAVTNRTLQVEMTPERSVFVGYGSYERVMDALEAAVSRTEYVAGDRFSAADVYLGSHIGYGLHFGGIERRPAFEAYHARLAGRPAFRRASEADDALLAAAKGQGG
ncbi:glutathione S-transferase family protein [Aureimonas phyllosphaerae]|uniref:Glutathione S-transferase n=1 Tax=Aureimonas phyllosphaerae TaxID=1166078 RepID=A0A7W6FUJ1_9HYPH|nr:glutathione S-transferase family protein [Aureimonas phyllosphaerae]MBB3935835.1 glutathione S-transferase [Aureimonas phyllosphaerae]MBB3959843.1 glutathione S-transferase [Aureimonas phyllosphaerae]SFF15694.1 glutathione S-transferase [Aureimonas phyllosphaerae]